MVKKMNSSDLKEANDRAEQSCAAQDKEAKSILNSYKLGTPLFQRSVLEAIDRQLAAGSSCVEILDFCNNPKIYNIKSPETIRIMYNGLQSLINPFPWSSRLMTQPVSICYVKCNKSPKYNLTESRIMFQHKGEAWEKSDTCIWIKHYFSTMILPTPIKKIICFGLGSPSLESEAALTPSYAQHAAVKTIAEALGGTNHTISCYAQDPIYNGIDKELLHELGIIPLADPKGFLEVDETTLVFSVSPDVPVRQIITDLQWPAAMVWDTVRPATEEKTEWEKIGDKVGVFAFGTDPSSHRVWEMIQKYSKLPFQGCDNLFGDLTIYLRT